jgi:hypothetical protein
VPLIAAMTSPPAQLLLINPSPPMHLAVPHHPSTSPKQRGSAILSRQHTRSSCNTLKIVVTGGSRSDLRMSMLTLSTEEQQRVLQGSCCRRCRMELLLR